ncbi:hypothetical protein M885DRAFT_551368 [Pelagophyceae sp. CCMP2097]|nr:hypothetical protein M885DRAFT_551368 [Pelagophyceae sp. CCMP2097]
MLATKARSAAPSGTFRARSAKIARSASETRASSTPPPQRNARRSQKRASGTPPATKNRRHSFASSKGRQSTTASKPVATRRSTAATTKGSASLICGSELPIAPVEARRWRGCAAAAGAGAAELSHHCAGAGASTTRSPPRRWSRKTRNLSGRGAAAAAVAALQEERGPEPVHFVVADVSPVDVEAERAGAGGAEQGAEGGGVDETREARGLAGVRLCETEVLSPRRNGRRAQRRVQDARHAEQRRRRRRHRAGRRRRVRGVRARQRLEDGAHGRRRGRSL